MPKRRRPTRRTADSKGKLVLRPGDIGTGLRRPDVARTAEWPALQAIRRRGVCTPLDFRYRLLPILTHFLQQPNYTEAPHA